MKAKNETERLLDAVLLDEGAHDASLAIVRRAARRRRWSGRIRNGTAAVLTLAIAGLLVRQIRTVEQEKPIAAMQNELVEIVRTIALPNRLLAGAEGIPVEVITTSETRPEIVSTAKAAPLERIDDELLLQLAPGAVLVRHNAREAELVLPAR